MARRKRILDPRINTAKIDWTTVRPVAHAYAHAYAHAETMCDALAEGEVLFMVTSKPRRRTYPVTKWDRHMYPPGSAHPHRTRYYAAKVRAA